MPDTTAQLVEAPPVEQTVSFHINGFDIDNALRALAPVINRRNTIPILSMVRIQGRSTALRFEGTDLDATFVYELPGDYPEFDVCVDYFTLAGFVRTLHSCMFRVEAGAATFRIHDFMFATPEGVAFSTLPALDLPELRHFEPGADIEFKPEMMARVRAAMSTEETRYYLNGTYLHAVDGELRLAATDGHRMNVLRTGIPYSGEAAIMPRNIAAWIGRQKMSGRLAICALGARYKCGNLTVRTKCVDGAYPDYGRVMPKESHLTAKVRRKALLNVIATLRAFNRTKSFALKFSFLGGDLTLHHHSIETGHVALKLEDVGFTGRLNAEAFEVGFNGGYVVDALNAVMDDEATFHFTDSSSPTLIQDGNLSLILMPLRV